MLINDLARILKREDLEELRELWKMRFYTEQQNRILDIYEDYIKQKLPRKCGKCRAEYIDKIRKVLKILEND